MPEPRSAKTTRLVDAEGVLQRVPGQGGLGRGRERRGRQHWPTQSLCGERCSARRREVRPNALAWLGGHTASLQRPTGPPPGRANRFRKPTRSSPPGICRVGRGRPLSTVLSACLRHCGAIGPRCSRPAKARLRQRGAVRVAPRPLAALGTTCPASASVKLPKAHTVGWGDNPAQAQHKQTDPFLPWSSPLPRLHISPGR